MNWFAYAMLALAAVGEEPSKLPTELNLGDKAPRLEIQSFVKGEPVKDFENGKTYVVEFWATWCGPCKESIPHLTELQKKHKEVVFIGVSVDTETEEVKPFVEKMGDKMNYRVALETPGEQDGKMSVSWLKASSQDGIPAAFVINGEGKIAWIGHPGELEEPLAQIVAGKWDLAAKVEEFKKSVAKKREVYLLSQKLAVEIEAQRHANALEIIDKLRGESDELHDKLGWVKLAILAGYGDEPAKAVALAKELFDTAESDQDGDGFAQLVHTLADPNGRLSGEGKAKPLTKELAKLAVDAGKKAWELSARGELRERLQVAHDLAKVQSADGQKEAAAQTLDEAAAAIQETIDQAQESVKELKALRKSLGLDREGAKDEKPADEKPKDKEPAKKAQPVEM